MKINYIRFFLNFTICILCMIAVLDSCSKDLDIPTINNRIPSNTGQLQRENSKETRRTLLLYSAAYNNLAKDLLQDIKDICEGYLPGGERYDDQIFIFSHQPKDIYDYQTPTTPYLMRVYKNRDGGHNIDTLITYPNETSSASAETFANVVDFVHSNYPSKEFGVIFSSHSTGWLPIGYYGKNSQYIMYRQPSLASNANMPMVKSIGAMFVGSYRNAFEMDIKDFASKLKPHLDYLIFDSCLMGGIEVAYELKDKCDKIMFSQTEVLSEGLDYHKIATRLFSGTETDLLGIAQDFFNLYKSMTMEQWRSATISIVDCRKLDAIANICSEIFRKHRHELDTIYAFNVQKYNNKGWFYDFRDILNNLNLSKEEARSIDSALAECILYKAATERFIDIEIKCHSGLSMYLERTGSADLDDYYKSLKWNIDTGYIQ